ncbi:alkaline phosphatase D family protein [Flammeovirgaceae bacterium SG7u.111]|nr:alkaline phosphatase D family protein [Flammeovirgaceae bacterium SG7u.132]WPO33027.1 alkaline phosphatase D family protein [Flammeovirgaceae bacterium SG7u.111]
MTKNTLISILGLALLVLGFTSCDKQTEKNEVTEPAITTIAFGSCNEHRRDQAMWKSVLNQQPQAWVWLGDNVYGDTEDMSLLKEKYDTQKANPDYTKLRENTKVFGIWDDHDYGVNDGGKEYPMKKESRDLMFEFLDISSTDPVWNREGAYNSYLIGEGDKKVKIILLDARYFRDTLTPSPDPELRYQPRETGTILGEEQWAWLEKEFEKNEAAIHLVGSGIQIIPDQHGWEKWGNFPHERQRLFDLIQQTKPNGAILLSGDRHIAEVSKVELEDLGYPLYEITASGLTHTWGEAGEEYNPHREGELIIKKNFGLLNIYWEENPLKVEVEIRGLADSLYQQNIFYY